MKSPIMLSLIFISLLLIAGRSSSRLAMKNGLFIVPDNPSDFDPNLNSVVEDGSTLNTADGNVEKDLVECDQETRPWRISSAKSATNEMEASFRLRPSFQRVKKPQSPTSANKSEGFLNLLPKGAVKPAGPSPNVNSMVTEQRLSTSSNSPGVGHMQMFRPKSQTLNGDALKSHESDGDDQVQQEKSSKRKLGGSTPSPGVGN